MEGSGEAGASSQATRMQHEARIAALEGAYSTLVTDHRQYGSLQLQVALESQNFHLRQQNVSLTNAVNRSEAFLTAARQAFLGAISTAVSETTVLKEELTAAKTQRGEIVRSLQHAMSLQDPEQQKQMLQALLNGLLLEGEDAGATDPRDPVRPPLGDLSKVPPPKSEMPDSKVRATAPLSAHKPARLGMQAGKQQRGLPHSARINELLCNIENKLAKHGSFLLAPYGQGPLPASSAPVQFTPPGLQTFLQRRQHLPFQHALVPGVQPAAAEQQRPGKRLRSMEAVPGDEN